MALLTKQEILNIQDIEIEQVDVVEWGGHVFVKGMSGLERDTFEASIVQQRGKDAKVNMVNIRAKLAAQTICDEEGVRMFTEKDVHALGKKSANALQRVFDVAQKLSGITGDDVDELAAELEKNPSEGSASD